MDDGDAFRFGFGNLLTFVDIYFGYFSKTSRLCIKYVNYVIKNDKQKHPSGFSCQ